MDTPNAPLPFATMLRRTRLAAGLTQEELAERARLSVRGITDLERGERRAPRKETVQLLADALALTPDTRAAFETAARRQASADSSASRPQPARASGLRGRTNLPLLLTSFVGRAHEQGAVRYLLSAHRLVTLTGSGGCGKTRLLLQLAGALLDDYPDGVWLVELAALGDPGLVPQAVASMLDVFERSDQPLAASLTDYLRSKRLLLALDNCEHLVAACAELASALLRVCPGLTILATSREALGVAGESAWKVPSLTLPEPEIQVTLESALASEAVQLFAQRAQAARAGFALTAHNAALAAQVCRRLDGLPLAIELAASRLETLSLEQLAARLDDRFRLLTGGTRTALPRQQTLRATLDWSHDLLTEPERVLLRRLSVFAGGWMLEAAETVCSGDGIAEDEVLDLLSGLVHRSLVMVDDGRAGGRCRLLETVRQYGHERLVAAGEAARVRDRHLDWYMHYAEQAFAGWMTAEQVTWAGRLALEQENQWTALAWSSGGRQHQEKGLRLASASSLFWNLQGFARDGQRWLETLLQDFEPGNPSARAWALTALSRLVWAQGEYERSAALSQSAYPLFVEQGDTFGRAIALQLQGMATIYLSDHRTATSLLEAALEAARACRSRGMEGWALCCLGGIAHLEGDLERAAILYERGLALLEETGNAYGIGNQLANLAWLARDRGRFEDAEQLHRRSLVVRIDLQDKAGFAECFEGLAVAASNLAQPERAARLFGAAEVVREAIARPIEFADRAAHERAVPSVREALGEGTFTAAWAAGRALQVEAAIALALEEQAGVDW